MRSYPINSPQAAARIVVLAMVADGDVGNEELDTLDRLGAREQIGLRPEELRDIVHELCDDLLTGAQLTWAGTCRVDPRTLAELLGEVDDPELRLKVLCLCISVVEADGHVTENESVLLGAVVEHWGLHHWMLQPERPERGVEHA